MALSPIVDLHAFEGVTHTDLNNFFDVFYNFLNNDAVHRDGTTAYTGFPTTEAATLAAQLTRYSWVRQHPMWAGEARHYPVEAPTVQEDESPFYLLNVEGLEAFESTAKITVQLGTINAAFTAGLRTSSFPGAFSNHVLAMLLCNADADAPGDGRRLKLVSTTLSTFTMRFGSFTGSHMVSYIAWGY